MIREQDKTPDQIEADNLMLAAVQAYSKAYYHLPAQRTERIEGWAFIAYSDMYGDDGQPESDVYTSGDSGLRDHEVDGLYRYAQRQLEASMQRPHGFH